MKYVSLMISLRMVNDLLSGIIDLGWNPYAQSMSNACSFYNTCPNIESSSWLGSVVSRRKFLKSVIENSNTKNSIMLSRCDLNFLYPPLPDEAFGNRHSGILFGLWYRSDQVDSHSKMSS